jgi:uncharacterized protein (DUF983 family)
MTPPAARRPNPILAGLAGRCPNCGKGPLFKGFIRVADRCSACGFDLKAADSGDGPAVFVVLIVGCIVVFAALYAYVAFRPPIWLLLATTLPMTVVLCLLFMRPFKGVLLALQFHFRASEARNDEF